MTATWWDGRVSTTTVPTLMSEAGEQTAWMEVYTRALFTATAGRLRIPTAAPIPDVDGIDLLLKFPRASMGVQLKSTYSLKFNRKGVLRFRVKPKWVEHWHREDVPPRLVLYVVDKDPERWCRHRGLGEMHRAHAYWAVLDKEVSVPSVTIEKKNRFTAATLEAWGRELEHGMGGRP